MVLGKGLSRIFRLDLTHLGGNFDWRCDCGVHRSTLVAPLVALHKIIGGPEMTRGHWRLGLIERGSWEPPGRGGVAEAICTAI